VGRLVGVYARHVVGVLDRVVVVHHPAQLAGGVAGAPAGRLVRRAVAGERVEPHRQGGRRLLEDVVLAGEAVRVGRERRDALGEDGEPQVVLDLVVGVELGAVVDVPAPQRADAGRVAVAEAADRVGQTAGVAPQGTVHEHERGEVGRPTHRRG
jgi:hypothetical protein